jgi:hypothetical protein
MERIQQGWKKNFWWGHWNLGSRCLYPSTQPRMANHYYSTRWESRWQFCPWNLGIAHRTATRVQTTQINRWGQTNQQHPRSNSFIQTLLPPSIQTRWTPRLAALGGWSRGCRH